MRVRNYNCSVNQLQRMTASDPGVFGEISFDILQDFERNCSAVGEANNLMLHLANLTILPQKVVLVLCDANETMWWDWEGSIWGIQTDGCTQEISPD